MNPFLAVILACLATLGLVINRLLAKVRGLETKAIDLEVSSLAEKVQTSVVDVATAEEQRKADLKAFQDSESK